MGYVSHFNVHFLNLQILNRRGQKISHAITNNLGFFFCKLAVTRFVPTFFFFTLCCSLICRSSLLINKYMYYKYLLSVCDLACHFMSSFTVYKSLMQPKWLFFSVFVFFKHYFWVLLNEIPPYLKVIQIVLYFSSKLQVLLFMLHFLST